MDNKLKEGLELFLNQNSEVITVPDKRPPVQHPMYGIREDK